MRNVRVAFGIRAARSAPNVSMKDVALIIMLVTGIIIAGIGTVMTCLVIPCITQSADSIVEADVGEVEKT